MQTKNKYIVGAVIAVILLAAVAFFGQSGLFTGRFFPTPFPIREKFPYLGKPYKPYKPKLVIPNLPIILKSANSPAGQILQAMQPIFTFDVVAPRLTDITVTSVTLACTGLGSANLEIDDNAMEIRVDGMVAVASGENSPSCLPSGRAMGPNIQILAGTQKTFKVSFDTSALPGQWATGEDLMLSILQDGFEWKNNATGQFSTAIANKYPIVGNFLSF